MSAASTPSEAQSAAVTPVGGPPKLPAAMLVMSGGEGYIDFRIGKGISCNSVYSVYKLSLLLLCRDSLEYRISTDGDGY